MKIYSTLALSAFPAKKHCRVKLQLCSKQSSKRHPQKFLAILVAVLNATWAGRGMKERIKEKKLKLNNSDS